ncbi:ATP-grasp domain-containing protein, partial [Corynebacterium bovis]|uniref:ATP-grasp domain-containing protein n=1 Tax=Corynebacterium bovis TaxID=36808 RepID=UPI00313A3FF5
RRRRHLSRRPPPPGAVMSVLLVDPFSSGSHYHGLLRDRGLTYHCVRTRRALDSGLADGATVPHLAVDDATVDDLDVLVQFSREHGVGTVVTGAESGVPVAEALKVELGLASPDFGEHGRRFWDKDLLYSTLRDAGVRVPRRFGVLTAGDVAAGAADAVRSIVSAAGFFGGTVPAAIVQEYVRGREYVVDTVSHRGRHHVLAVCTYDKHPSSTGAMVYDRIRWLDGDAPDTTRLTAYAGQVLTALDHREGSVHMEVILDDRGPCLIDFGVRPHGAGHPVKTHALTGSSQLHAEVDIAAGGDLPDTPGYTLTAPAAIEFLSLDRPGTVRADARPEELLDRHFVRGGSIAARPGASYPETQSLLDSEALGLVFVDSVDDATLLENAARLRADFAAMVDPTAPAPTPPRRARRGPGGRA